MGSLQRPRGWQVNDSRNHSHSRKLICDEAARIMAEEGVRDYQRAKRKASDRLALGQSYGWPTNLEVERALSERLRLYSDRDRLSTLARMRRVALEAMGMLSDFSPRIVGSVLSGNVTPHTPVELHVFADTLEQVALFVEESGVPVEAFDKRFRFGGDRYVEVPCLRFTAEEVEVLVSIFGHIGLREPPLDPVDGRPMRRVTRKALENIVFA